MSWGVTVNIRHRSLDAIPFTKSDKFKYRALALGRYKDELCADNILLHPPPFETNIFPDIEGVKRKVVVTRNDLNQNKPVLPSYRHTKPLIT